LTTDHGPRTADYGALRDIPALAFAISFPALLSWLYLVVLRGPEDMPAEASVAVRAAFGAGKFVQFSFPLAYVWFFERERLRPARPTLQGLALGLGFGLLVSLAMFAMFFGGLGGSAPFAGTPDKIFRLLQEMSCATPGRYWLLATTYAVAHSLLEEYYWRWFVFGWLRRYAPVPVAIVISALGFMAHHVVLLGVYFPGWFWVLAMPLSMAVAIGGAVWAWVYHRSGSLYAAWLSHGVVDAAAFIVGYAMLLPFWEQ
jgi:uncharacterized protein